MSKFYFMKKLILKLLLLSLFNIFCVSIYSQTPPARTWYYKNEQKTTVKERWDENNEGLKHGTYIAYFENGDRATLGHYKNGEKDGEWIVKVHEQWFWENTLTITTANYKNGVLSGSFEQKVNDWVMSKGQYINGKKNGNWIENFNKEEGIYQRGDYLDGNRVGKWQNALYDRTKEDYLSAMNNGYIYYEAFVSKAFKTKQGFITYFNTNGDFLKCIDDEIQGSSNVLEKKDFELLKPTSTLDNLNLFLTKYPNSSYKGEVLEYIRVHNETKRIAEEKERCKSSIGNLLDLIDFANKYSEKTNVGLLTSLSESIDSEAQHHFELTLNEYEFPVLANVLSINSSMLETLKQEYKSPSSGNNQTMHIEIENKICYIKFNYIQQVICPNHYAVEYKRNKSVCKIYDGDKLTFRQDTRNYNRWEFFQNMKNEEFYRLLYESTVKINDYQLCDSYTNSGQPYTQLTLFLSDINKIANSNEQQLANSLLFHHLKSNDQDNPLKIKGNKSYNLNLAIFLWYVQDYKQSHEYFSVIKLEHISWRKYNSWEEKWVDVDFNTFFKWYIKEYYDKDVFDKKALISFVK